MAPGMNDSAGSENVFRSIVGDGPAMREVFRMTRRVAPTRTSVLLVGETGTGKELIARAVHHSSPRASGPFVRVNCGALSESLLESELFGHVQGAFTGAISNRTGRFEAAHTGTIFLDEIGSVPMHLQVKLLRVLQEREFERVGDTRTVAVDTRVLSATNKDLPEAIRRGQFREDLYYRLNVVQIRLPSLRERPEDIADLVHYFLEGFSRETGRAVPQVTPELMAALVAYPWPGNVRELENCIERALVLCEGDVLSMESFDPAGLVPKGPGRPTANNTVVAVREWVRDAIADLRPDANDVYRRVCEPVEREVLAHVLADCDGVQTKAAQRLGINRNTLHRKIKELGLTEWDRPG